MKSPSYIIVCTRRQPKVNHYVLKDFDQAIHNPNLLCGQRTDVVVKSYRALPICKTCERRSVGAGAEDGAK